MGSSGEDEVVICCDVKVLRDDGYGSMTTKHKEKCSAPIRVEDQSRSRHNLVSISADVLETGSVGETVPIVCNARNLDLYHTLRLMVNGRTLQERRDQTVQYSLPLHQTHFTRSSERYGQEEAVVSCLVKNQRGLTIANDTRLIRKGSLKDLHQCSPLTGLAWEIPEMVETSRQPSWETNQLLLLTIPSDPGGDLQWGLSPSRQDFWQGVRRHP